MSKLIKMTEDQDQQILKQLKKKRKSFSEILNKKRVDLGELDRAMQEDF